MLSKAFFLVLRITFGIILIYASIDKILHPFQFAQVIENYQVLGVHLSRWLAIWLPWLELITGILLITGIWLDAAITVNLAMMSVFLIAIFQAYIRDLNVECGCFSTQGGTHIGFTKLLFNISLLIGSLIMCADKKIRRNSA